MPGTKIDICNDALNRIGDRLISSLDDGTPTADLLKNRYDVSRRKVLRSHPWKRLMKRATLAPLTTAPEFQWENAFPLPSDCLRLWLVVDNRDGAPINEWEFEGSNILANETVLYIKYIRDEENVDLLDDSLNEVISLQLAKELAFSRSGDGSLYDRIENEYRIKFAEARSIDAKEDYQKTISATEWTNAQETGLQPTKYPNLA
jgi:hypothetical protein